MKHLTAGVLLGAGLLLTSCKEKSESGAAASGTADAPKAAVAKSDGHVLAKKDALPPVGKTRTKEMTMEMKEAALNIEAAGQKMEGTMSRKDTKVETLETLSAGKARRILVSSTGEGTMVMNGQEQPAPEPKDPLVGVPVILELKDGKWTAALESGAATPELEKELDKVVKEYTKDDDLAMYGDKPRKPGDKWDVDPKTLSNFGDAQDLTGSFNVEFVEVKEVQGVRCAVLKTLFDVAGDADTDDATGAPAMKIKLKGEALVHRSLADLIDVDGKITGNMAIDGTPAPQVNMHAEGPMILTNKASIK